MKEITEKDGRIFISLTYCPKTTTLKRKFGSLPIKYLRTRANNQEEFKILEDVVRRYDFNLVDDEPDNIPQQSRQINGVKRKLYLEPTRIEDEIIVEVDDDEDGNVNNNGDDDDVATTSSSFSGERSSRSMKRKKKTQAAPRKIYLEPSTLEEIQETEELINNLLK